MRDFLKLIVLAMRQEMKENLTIGYTKKMAVSIKVGITLPYFTPIIMLSGRAAPRQQIRSVKDGTGEVECTL